MKKEKHLVMYRDDEDRRRAQRERTARWRKANPEGHKAIARRARQTLRQKIMLASAKERAALRGLPFAITADDIVVPDVCPILGIPLTPGPGRAHGNSPTLDRIRPELGYVPGNVAVISHRANRLKSDATLDELDRITTWVRTQLELSNDAT